MKVTCSIAWLLVGAYEHCKFPWAHLLHVGRVYSYQSSEIPSGLYKVAMHVLTLSHFTFRRAHLAHDLDDRGRLDVGASPDIFE